MSASPEGEVPDADTSTPLENRARYDALWNQESWTANEPAPSGGRECPVGTASPPPLLRVIEALLFVGGSPLTPDRAATAVRGLTAQQFSEAVDALNQAYRRQGRPYAIQPRDQGYLLVLRTPFRGVLDRLYGQAREARLSAAAVDVLSLVAYRQPVTKQEVDSIRGVESGTILRQLVRRGLIAVVQRGQSNQREVSYGTTARFLQLFKLRNLDDLPRTQDLDKI